ncbi:zinc finger protein 235-like isoform X2 [Uranotaenia lowii]|nr:zinc finger protein 235-like isoform X2 [Uranotaenia lowii]
MEQICRLCLQQNSALEPLHDAEDVATEIEKGGLIGLVEQYLTIQITKSEISKNCSICGSCRTTIEEWHHFREYCLRNDEIYHDMVCKATSNAVVENEAHSNLAIVKLEGGLIAADCNEEPTSASPKPPEGEEEYLILETIDYSDAEEYPEEEKQFIVHTDEKEPQISDKIECNSNIPLKKRMRLKVEVDNRNQVQLKEESDREYSEDDTNGDDTVSSKGRKRNSKKDLSKGEKRTDVCSICGKFIKNMTEHMRIHNNERRHQCPYCPKAFVSASNYNSHVNIHTRAKMYKCDLCEKQYTMLNSLKQHRITHFKERIYLCPVCGKAYYQPTGLARHKRSHFEEPKIKCSKCDKMFLTNADLKKHFSKHLEEKPFNCDICKRGFSRKDNLKTHMKTHQAKSKTLTTLKIESFVDVSHPDT